MDHVEDKVQLMNFFQSQGANWVSEMVSLDINDGFCRKLEQHGLKFFKRIGTGAEIKAEIKSKLLSSIGRDLSKTLPRLLSVSTPEKKMRLLKAMGNIYKGMEENNVKLEKKVGLKNLLKEIQIFEKTQKLEKGGAPWCSCGNPSHKITKTFNTNF